MLPIALSRRQKRAENSNLSHSPNMLMQYTRILKVFKMLHIFSELFTIPFACSAQSSAPAYQTEAAQVRLGGITQQLKGFGVPEKLL
jgi:hypothetical protein